MRSDWIVPARYKAIAKSYGKRRLHRALELCRAEENDYFNELRNPDLYLFTARLYARHIDVWEKTFT